MSTWVHSVGSSPSAIVVLDGKNAPHASFGELTKMGFNAHIFVAQKNGSHVHNPAFKGSDYGMLYRAGELEKIAELNRLEGIAVLVVQPMFSEGDSEKKLAEAIESVKLINPDIKIVGVGRDSSLGLLKDRGVNFDACFRDIEDSENYLKTLGLKQNTQGKQ